MTQLPPTPFVSKDLAHLHAWRWPLLSTLLVGLLIALASRYFHTEAYKETHDELNVIAELKALDIEHWLEHQRANLKHPPNGGIAGALNLWRSKPRSPASDAALRERLGIYQNRLPESRSLSLYDAEGRFIQSSDPEQSYAPNHLQPTTLTTLKPGAGPQLLDIHPQGHRDMALSFAVPILAHASGPAETIGFLVMEIDPSRYLYPMLQSWPGHSASAEVVLWQYTRDAVALISPLRFAPDEPLGKLMPPEELQITPAQLQARQPLFSAAEDYRRVKVLRHSHPIAGTDWWVIAKVDAAEVYAQPLRNSLLLGTTLLGLLALIWWVARQGHQHALDAARQQQARQEQTLLRVFIDAVPETLFMLNKDGRIKLINETGASRLGGWPDTLIGSNMFDRLPAELLPSRRAAIERACTGTEPVTLSDTRNGIDFQSWLYPLGDGEHAVVIAIDTTRQNQDARALQQLSQTLQSFIDHLPGTAYVKDHQSRVLIANQGFKTLLGIEPAGMIGRLSSEIFPGEFGERMVADDLRILTSGQTEVIEESFNGRFYESTKFLIPHPDGPPMLGGLTLDVTARQAAITALRKHEEELRILGDNIPEGFVYQVVEEADGSRHFTYLSAGFETLFGIRTADIVQNISLFFMRIDPEMMAAVRAEQQKALQGEFDMTVRMRLADGEYGWVHLHSRRRPGANEQGQIIWDGVALDVSRDYAQQAQLALHAQRATALLDLPVQAERLDESAFMTHAQDLAEQLTASQIAFIHFLNEDEQTIELVAWSHNTLAHYCNAAFDKHYPIHKAGVWADAARSKAPVIINDYARHPGKRGLPDGHSPLQRLISVPVLENGKVCMIAGIGNKQTPYTDTDVETLQLLANETWRLVRKERAEKVLQQALQVVEASPVVCFRWRAEEGWPVTYVSDNVRRWGYTPTELLNGSRSYVSLIHPDDLARVADETQQYITQGINEYRQEYRLLRPDGSDFWITDATRLTRDASGAVIHIDGLLNDISERKAQELKLAKQLAAEQALGKKLEEAHNQLLQAEKLAAIGQLAAGVAHELNNPIGFVHSNLATLSEYVTTLINLCDSYSTLIEEQHPECPQLDEIRRIKRDQDYNYLRGDIFPLLEESREGLVRVRKIVQDLRDFSRTGNQDWGMADLHKGLDSTLNIVANELKYKCTVTKEYGDLPDVNCVISQLNQVFMNLLVNAAQAIDTQGQISLKSGMEGDDQVWISISDSGKGIEPEHLNRIFEPFFTTKPVGIGTGLGLSLVFGIITRHHGRIEVSSTPGVGTTFRIVLPIQQPTPQEAT